MTRRLAFGFVALILFSLPCLAATAQEELHSTFVKFIAAQNAHDVKGVEALLLDSPQFLWIVRGVPVWGRADAIKKFEMLYQGTWHLEPDPENFHVVQVKGDMAQIMTPVVVTIGAPGQQARQALIYWNQTLIKSGGIWRIASILPVSVPTPRE